MAQEAINRVLFQVITTEMKALALKYFEAMPDFGITIEQVRHDEEEYEFIMVDRSIHVVRFRLDGEKMRVFNRWGETVYHHWDPNCFKEMSEHVATNIDKWVKLSLRYRDGYGADNC